MPILTGSHETEFLENHHRACIPWVHRLISGGRSDSTVLSVLIAESFFRGPLDRLLEYVVWILLVVLWKDRMHRLSVGVGQIQLRHWSAYYNWTSLSPTSSRLASVLSLEANYDVCSDLIGTTGRGGESLRRIAARYTGESRFFYVSVLQRTHDWLNRSGLVHG